MTETMPCGRCTEQSETLVGGFCLTCAEQLFPIFFGKVG